MNTDTGTHRVLELGDRILRDGGATVQLDNWETPTEGWVVAIRGHERITGRTHLYGDLAEYIQAAGPVATIGAWVVGDKIILDHIEVFGDRGFAIGVARARSQTAIFNLETKETVYL